LAEEIAKEIGGSIEELEGGFKVTIPHGRRGIVVRIMNHGGGRRNYY
jgi:hypothetical protein